MDIEPLDTRRDVREAVRAHGLAWRRAYADILPEAVRENVTVEATAEDVDAWLDRRPDAGVTLGARVEGTVRGYVLVRWADTKAFVPTDGAGLKEIYVHPDWWNEGIGTALLEAAVGRVPADVRELTLEVLAANDRGCGFYEARGFAPVDNGTVEIAGGSFETVIYRRQLPATGDDRPGRRE